MESTAIQVRQSSEMSAPMNEHDIKSQVDLIQRVMKSVMKDKEHYGVIPGCGKKPALLKAGAEKLAMTFRLAAEYDVLERDMPGGHREYQVKTTLQFIMNGAFMGQGVGCCSTMEGKYRFRVGEVEFTGKVVPKEYWTARDQALLGGPGFSTKKNPAGQWEIVRAGAKVEHDNPADYYNTVLKMAKKRSLVDAILTSTAASDIFTQDIEEAPELYGGKAVSDADTETEQPQGDYDDPEFRMREEIQAWGMEAVAGNVDEFKNWLRDITSFNGKDGKPKYKTDVKELSGKWLSQTHHKAKERHEKPRGGTQANTTPADDGLPF